MEDEVKKLGLSKYKKLQDMKCFLKDKVDIFIKPLVVSLMKSRPNDVYGAIKHWVINDGLLIYKKLNGLPEDTN